MIVSLIRHGCRNKANFGVSGFGVNGLRGLGMGFGGARGLEEGEFPGGVFVGALQAFDVALEAGEDGIGQHVNAAEGSVFGEVLEFLELVFPKLGIGAGESAHMPITEDQDVDVEALLGSDWGARREILVSECFEIGGILAVCRWSSKPLTSL